MPNYCVNKSLLLHHSLLIPCNVMYKIYVIQCIAILFIFIVAIIVNERFAILIIVYTTILLFVVG
jgi:hypothetical protein